MLRQNSNILICFCYENQRYMVQMVQNLDIDVIEFGNGYEC